MAIALPTVMPDAAGVVDAQEVPFEVSTLPDVPGATLVTADVPLPINTELALNEAAPVPPAAAGSTPSDNCVAELA